MDEDTRRELDQLHQADRDLRQAISDLDNHGSRGVLQLTQQVMDLVKDFAEMKIVFGKHEEQHDKETRERRSSRRWYIGTVIAAMGGLGGIFYVLVEILQHVH